MTHSLRSCILALAALAGGCERAQAPAPDAGSLAKQAPVSIAGQIVLAGELARARRGCVVLRAWPAQADDHAGAQPLLLRSYEIGDPDWTEVEGELRRYFGLCDADRVGESTRALPEELEIEACFECYGPSGVDTLLVRGSTHARNGAQQLSITVAPRIEMAQPQSGRKKGG